MEISFLSDEQKRRIELGRKGGSSPKHFTPESKRKQIEGASHGGLAPKHYTPESKARLVEGARLGSQRAQEQRRLNKLSLNFRPTPIKGQNNLPVKTPEERRKEAARRGGLAPKHFTVDGKIRQREGARLGGLRSKGRPRA